MDRSHPALVLLNLLVPGAGLVVAGRLTIGVVLLLPTVLVVAVAGLAAGILVRPLAVPVLFGCLAAWSILAVISGLVWWWWARRCRIDPVRVRLLHREAAGAWLRGEATALAAARRLAAAAPEEPGAWRLLALIARDQGEPATVRAAERRAAAIEAR